MTDVASLAVPAVAALAGVGLSALLGRTAEARSWRRQRRTDAYVGLLGALNDAELWYYRHEGFTVAAGTQVIKGLEFALSVVNIHADKHARPLAHEAVSRAVAFLSVDRNDGLAFDDSAGALNAARRAFEDGIRRSIGSD
jgi:hypothetical protein